MPNTRSPPVNQRGADHALQPPRRLAAAGLGVVARPPPRHREHGERHDQRRDGAGHGEIERDREVLLATDPVGQVEQRLTSPRARRSPCRGRATPPRRCPAGRSAARAWSRPRRTRADCSGSECTWISPGSSAVTSRSTGCPTPTSTRSPDGFTSPSAKVISIVFTSSVPPPPPSSSPPHAEVPRSSRRVAAAAAARDVDRAHGSPEGRKRTSGGGGVGLCHNRPQNPTSGQRPGTRSSTGAATMGEVRAG